MRIRPAPAAPRQSSRCMAPNASRNWAPKRSSTMQAVDLAGNPKTSGPGLTQRSRFPSTTAVPIPEISPEADTSCGHVKDRRLAAIGSLAPGLVAAILGAGLGLSFGHDELGYPACFAVTGALFWVFAHMYVRYRGNGRGLDGSSHCPLPSPAHEGPRNRSRPHVDGAQLRDGGYRILRLHADRRLVWRWLCGRTDLSFSTVGCRNFAPIVDPLVYFPRIPT